MSTPETVTSKEPRRRRAAVIVAVLAVAAVGAGGWMTANRWTSERFAQQMQQEEALDPDARLRRLAVGAWTDEYEGKRTMTLHSDGSGTMVVELTGWRAALAAPRLKFNMKWSIHDGRLRGQTTGGEPEAQVKMIMSTMGDHVEQPIVELTAEHLILLDKDGKTRYDWTRLAGDAATMPHSKSPSNQ